MMQLVYLEEKSVGRACELDKLYVRDLNLSFDWGSAVEEKCPCVVNTSIMWVWGKARDGRVLDRRLSATEVLSVQGYNPVLQCDFMKELTFERKMDLAGNMFSGEVYSAVFAAAIANLPIAHALDLLVAILLLYQT